MIKVRGIKLKLEIGLWKFNNKRINWDNNGMNCGNLELGD